MSAAELLVLPASLSALAAQTLLLRGPQGSRATEHALALAALYVCDNPLGSDANAPAATATNTLTDRNDSQRRPALQACQRCNACHLFEVRNHPDVRTLAPEGWMLEQGWPLPYDVQHQLDSKARKPARKTGIDQVRSLIDFAHSTATKPQGKVALIPLADHMTVEAANALLKVLEEPPGSMRFILSTSAAHLLLPTIVSRCTAYVLPWQADALACSAEERRLPQRLAQGDSTALAALSPAAAVLLCHKLCHDLARVASGADPLYFQVSDLPKAPALALLLRWQKLLIDMQRHIEHPWREALLLENLAVQSMRILRS